jgi:hypothetical protein
MGGRTESGSLPSANMMRLPSLSANACGQPMANTHKRRPIDGATAEGTIRQAWNFVQGVAAGGTEQCVPSKTIVWSPNATCEWLSFPSALTQPRPCARPAIVRSCRHYLQSLVYEAPARNSDLPRSGLRELPVTWATELFLKTNISPSLKSGLTPSILITKVH